MVKVTVDDRGRVEGTADCLLPAPSGRVWGWMRDWRRFMEMDPLHVRVERLDPPARHANLLIRHRLLGFGTDRVGRIVKWREGHGFAFSDLSQRGPDVGFPHICTYQLHPLAEGRSRIVVGVRGKWTARRVPRVLVRLWIGWVLVMTVVMIRAHSALAARRWRVGESGWQPEAGLG